MGKSNRIRTKKANEKLATSTQIKRKEKKGMPSWAMSLIAIVITVAVLLTVAFSLLSSNGVFLRMRTAASSENYKVNGNMMSYFFNVTYSNFTQEYADYLTYFSLNASEPLKNQTYGVAATEGGYAWETNLLGAFEGTWYDYFVKQTEAEVKNILIYCEEAEKLGIELTDEDRESIDASIDSLSTIAGYYGYTTGAYIASMYGNGVSKNDVRKAMELSTLAQKCSEHISDTIEEGVTDERIDAEYNENKTTYDKVDFLSYTFTVKLTDVKKEVLGADFTAEEYKAEEAKVLEEYAKKIDEKKALAATLAGKTSVEDFEKFVLLQIAETKYDTYLNGATFTADDKPSADDLKTLREKITAQIVDDVMADKDASTLEVKTEGEKTTLCDVEMTDNCGDIFETIIEDTFEDVLESKDPLTSTGVAFTDDKDEDAESVSDWAFADGRKLLDTKSFETGDGADGAEVKAEKENFTSTVYMIKKTQYKNTEKTKNVAYAAYSSEDSAKAAIEALAAKGELTLEAFEEYMSSDTNSSGSNTIENYTEGGLGIEAFDTWLFDDERKLGDYTATPVKLDTSTYAIIYYYDDGVEEWFNSVKSVLFTEDYDEYFNEMTETYTVTINEKVTSKIKQA